MPEYAVAITFPQNSTAYEARKAIREQKRQERKESPQQRVDALKAKFRKQWRTGLFASADEPGISNEQAAHADQAGQADQAAQAGQVGVGSSPQAE